MSTADLWKLISFVLKDFQKRGRRRTLKGWAALAAREDRARRSPPMESGCTMGRADPARWGSLTEAFHWIHRVRDVKLSSKERNQRFDLVNFPLIERVGHITFNVFFPPDKWPKWRQRHQPVWKVWNNETKNIVLWNFRKWSHLAFLDILVANWHHMHCKYISDKSCWPSLVSEETSTGRNWRIRHK